MLDMWFLSWIKEKYKPQSGRKYFQTQCDSICANPKWKQPFHRPSENMWRKAKQATVKENMLTDQQTYERTFLIISYYRNKRVTTILATL